MTCKVEDLIIEPLGEHHSREAFCCGNDIIDRFFVKRSLNDHNAYKVRVRVAINGENGQIVGFYSLSLKTLAPQTILGSKFGKWDIPAVYLSMVGTHEEYHGMGVGSELMRHAFERTLEIADIAGTACLTLDAVDEEKAAWYESLTFQRITEGELSMYIPIGTLKQLSE